MKNPHKLALERRVSFRLRLTLIRTPKSPPPSPLARRAGKIAITTPGGKAVSTATFTVTP